MELNKLMIINHNDLIETNIFTLSNCSLDIDLHLGILSYLIDLPEAFVLMLKLAMQVIAYLTSSFLKLKLMALRPHQFISNVGFSPSTS